MTSGAKVDREAANFEFLIVILSFRSDKDEPRSTEPKCVKLRQQKNTRSVIMSKGSARII